MKEEGEAVYHGGAHRPPRAASSRSRTTRGARWFAEQGVEPLTIVYEDLAADTQRRHRRGAATTSASAPRRSPTRRCGGRGTTAPRAGPSGTACSGCDPSHAEVVPRGPAAGHHPLDGGVPLQAAARAEAPAPLDARGLLRQHALRDDAGRLHDGRVPAGPGRDDHVARGLRAPRRRLHADQRRHLLSQRAAGVRAHAPLARRGAPADGGRARGGDAPAGALRAHDARALAARRAAVRAARTSSRRASSRSRRR